MTIEIERPSARIIPFPVASQRSGRRWDLAVSEMPVRIAGFGDGWHHDEAIREADKTPVS